jgi:dynein heavy chain
MRFSWVDHVRRGLMREHKMTWTTFTCLSRIEGDMDEDVAAAEASKMDTTRAEEARKSFRQEMQILIAGKQVDTGVPMSPALSNWLPKSAWHGLQALKDLPAFSKLQDDIDSSPDAWKSWFDLEKPEQADMPSNYSKNLDDWKQILVLRVVRPDRVTPALTQFIKKRMGARYIDEALFDMRACFNESSSSTPIFFVLFPGVDVTQDVESLGKMLGFTAKNGKYVNISMGQGQERVAAERIDTFAKSGGWVFLQQINLVASWLPSLERALETAKFGHGNFRCFLSCELSGLQSVTIPPRVLQSSIKIANELPVDAKASLRMAYANFSEETWASCAGDKKKLNDCKRCLFTLCIFHTMLLGRKKFGYVGWSRAYPFNTSDLTICGSIIVAYVRDQPETPYADLRYLIGEIMYGGHITDPWDRRMTNNELTVLFTEALTQPGSECIPNFPMPDPARTDYAGYCRHIEERLPPEDPTMYRLHPNAGIGNLMNATSMLFMDIGMLTMQHSNGGSGSASGGGGASIEDAVSELVTEYLAKCPNQLEISEVRSRIKEETPYIICLLLECERMNELLFEVRHSLIDLQEGLKGNLDMTKDMEALMGSLFASRVPAAWERVAYASLKGLVGWWADMVKRVNQLTEWSGTLLLPKSVWIAGLFSVDAFLTAVNQTAARRDSLPLDTMDTIVDVTELIDPSSLEAPTEDGAMVDGLCMEGARWDSEAGGIAESVLKDLHPAMPLLHIFSQQAPAFETRVSEQGYFECPVFACTTRGANDANAIWAASIKMVEGDRKEKWISAAVCLLLAAED